MSQDQRRNRLPSSYGASGNRSTLGYWVPLALTVTAATVGLAAWIWSERDNDEDAEHEAEQYYQTNRPQGQGPGGLNNNAAGAGYGMSGARPPGPGPDGMPQPPGAFEPGPPLTGGFQGGPQPPQGSAGAYYRDESSRAMSTGVTQSENQGFVARMSNAVGLGGNNSNSNNYNNNANQQNNTTGGWAGRSLAAAGAMVGGAVNSIRQFADDGQHFSDQEKWSEEADKPERTMSPKKSGPDGRSLQRQGTAAEFYAGAVEPPRQSSISRVKRRTVAVVVSSVSKGTDGQEVDAHQSILAQLPEFLHPESTRIIILIYAPDLSTHPMSLISRRAVDRQQAYSTRSQSTSSYAKINTPAQTPGDFPQDSQNESSDDKGILAHVDPKPVETASSSRTGSRNNSRPRASSRSKDRNAALERQTSNPVDETSSLFKTLYNQANALVDRETSILPYSTRDGHKNILRSIQPEIVYIQEPLCGTDGSVVTELQGWVRQTVVVIGDEGGLGGLVDSDTEDTKKRVPKGGHWWQKESVTGLGRGVSVVESMHVAEDWQRRVNNRE